MAPGQSNDRLYELLTGALQVWRLERPASVRRNDDGSISIGVAEGVIVTVSRLPKAGAERWQVAVRPPPSASQADETVSAHVGTPGMLRAVRAALAPGSRPARMIVAPPPPD